MISTSNKSRLLAGVAGLVIFAAGTAAFAADRDGVRSYRVSAADLNVATDDGAAALYQRISWAAHQVCSEGNTMDLATQMRVRKCEHEAIARAVDGLGSPRLAMLHANRTRHG
ncbi:MAG: UrcA family protein [Sinobacteraceae bacterium]|nr:UrcA family protein [Nevskiaceae bacterium]